MKKFLLRFKRLPLLLSFLGIIVVMADLPDWKAHARKFHTPAELQRLHEVMATLPVDTNTYFAASGRCSGCHGHDPAGVAFMTSSGEDVNIADDWAGTMMANSAKDPFWRAKVSHEILVNPGEQVTIENTCTRCHAPTGRFEAEYTGMMPYSIAAMAQDSIAMDGVNCSACHQQKDSLLGRNFSGDLHYKKKHVWGPYQNPFAGPMEFFIGFTPEYGAHINHGGLCGGCHTLITETHDLSGNPTGEHFVEQATYHEWLNSSYSDSMSTLGRTCQSCHIPRIYEPIDIATNYPFLQGRQPFGKHHLIGGNAFMLKLMRNNMPAIGATCTPANFDTTIARTTRYLRDSTLDCQLIEGARVNDTIHYRLALKNKCGHKFPSGYPSRRAFVEFVVMDDNGDTLFKSGMRDSNGDLIGQDAFVEPHHDVITDGAQQVQIYEMAVGDVNNNLTTVLERADTTFKDNRLAPLGFNDTYFAYDTCRIYGDALNDPDFNRTGMAQGTGADTVHYNVWLNGYTGDLNVTARVYYQSVPKRWLAEMFTFNSPEIDTFRNMFGAADQTPMLVAECLMGGLVTGTNNYELPQLQITPNPTSDGKLFVRHYEKYDIRNISVYDLSGKLVASLKPGGFDGTLQLPRKGVYIVSVETARKRYAQKVIYY